MNLCDLVMHRRFRIQCFGMADMNDLRRNIEIQKFNFLTVKDASEYQDPSCDAGLSKAHGLFQSRNREPAYAFRGKPSCTLDRSMAVCIRLHDGHYLNFASDESLDFAEVGREVVEIDFRPCGAIHG
jgi:hypothetical protein